jgi:hypothetical protein
LALFQSANAGAATAQADKKKSSKARNKHTVEASADDTEGTSKVVEEPAPESKRVSESADYDASQLHEFSQVIPFAADCCALYCSDVLPSANAVNTLTFRAIELFQYLDIFDMYCT